MPPLKFTDDFNWATYTTEYANQTEEMISKVGRTFLLRNWSVGPDGLPIFHDNLSEGWREIYSTAFSLKPATIFECGCGSMYHLHNLGVLLPQAKIYGCDLLLSQLYFGSLKWQLGHQTLKRVRILDFSQPDATEELGRYEFVYTQAVVMHLAFDKAVRFIQNMMKISSKYIMMLENTDFQDFDAVYREVGILNEFDISYPNRYEQYPHARLFTRKIPLA